MPLPGNYDAWEHFQSVLIKVQNRVVRAEFLDLGGDDWLLDISTPRSSLRTACTLTDQDTSTLTLLRLFLFYFILRKARDFTHPVYGTPLPALQRSFKFQPQVVLYFLEDAQDLEPGQDPASMKTSFRLMDETSSTITAAKINAIADAINSEFNKGGGYVVKKGKDVCSYTDPELGYKTWGFFRNKNEGIDYYRKVVSIQNHKFKLSKFNYKENGDPAAAFPTVPEQIDILGKSTELNTVRPIAETRLQYGIMHLHGRKVTIPLVDRTGIFLDAIHGVLGSQRFTAA